MSEGGSADEGGGSEPLWRFVPESRRELPPEPPTESVRRNWRRLVGRLGAPEAADEAADGDDARPAPAAPREDVVPPPDPDGQAAALAEALKRAGSPSRVAILDPPGAGAAEALERLAARWGLPVLGPGISPGDILAAAADGPAAVPRLERMFLRTPAGLDRARALVGALVARRHPVLVGCGSWAWRYLEAALGVGLGFPHRLVPAPLDAARLRHWLGAAPGLRCRERGSGAWLVGGGDGRDHRGPGARVTREGATREGDSGGPHAFFRHLAARSRGSPGMAAALWARALGQGAGEHDHDGDSGGGSGGGGHGDGALVVPPWRHLRLPDVGTEPPREALLCLQALLVHGPLDVPTLGRLLPIPAQAVGLHLARLEAEGVVAHAADGQGWQVVLAAYPSVRQALADAGHWVDA